MPTAAERANQLNQAARAAYDAIDAAPRLSNDAKRDDKIRAWAKLNRELKATRAAEAAARETRRLTLERDLFGLRPGATASDVIAHRDAVGRAAALAGIGHAARAMQSARVIGDDQLVRAIAARAIEQGWDALVGAYVGEIQPDAAPKVAALTRASTRSLQDEAFVEWQFIATIPSGVGTTSTAVLQSRAAQLDARDGVTDLTASQSGQAETVGLLSMLVSQLDAGEEPTTDWTRGAASFDNGDDTYFDAAS